MDSSAFRTTLPELTDELRLPFLSAICDLLSAAISSQPRLATCILRFSPILCSIILVGLPDNFVLHSGIRRGRASK